MRRFGIVIALGLTTACRQSGPVLPLPLAQNFGIVTTTAAGACLTIRNAMLKPNTAIYFIDDTHAGKGIVTGPGQPCRTAVLDQDVEYYAVNFAAPPDGVELAIVNYTGTLTARSGILSADLDGDGLPEQIHSCTSAEGLHFTLWSGPPITGKLLWHYYHYVPYDTESSCKEPGEVGVTDGTRN